jgi:hypothetical protein
LILFSFIREFQRASIITLANGSGITLDFCQKYHFPESKPESIPHFIKKLQKKHQSSQQQKQAAVALSLFYAIVRSDPEDNFIEIANSWEQSQPSRQQQHTASPVSCS